MLFRRHLLLAVVALGLLAGTPACRPAPLIAPSASQDSGNGFEGLKSPLIASPPAPILTDAGHALILEFETGGRSGYNPRPEWPGGSSGFTIGVGYDCGYFSRAAIAADWSALPKTTLTRIDSTAGLTRGAAQQKVSECRDILIGWDTALGVFHRVDVARTWGQCERAFPGFLALRPNAQAALVSLVFNRGASMVGSNRSEMREIRDMVPKRDYDGIAGQLRAMVRVWRGTDIFAGMRRRRLAEAELVLKP